MQRCDRDDQHNDRQQDQRNGGCYDERRLFAFLKHLIVIHNILSFQAINQFVHVPDAFHDAPERVCFVHSARKQVVIFIRQV
ncbi:hypothetical protein SDC9_173996 [bioreactor metagenome]|uniref:Uncharacterized protein n=1 Tax=bioreactor metagenome TaxID=1076179 RepID=A0A645GHW6_9ZZZZ